MSKQILTLAIRAGSHIQRYSFHSGINILCGQHAAEILPTLSGIFGGTPVGVFCAELQWQDGVILSISGAEGQVFLEGIRAAQGDPAQWAKDFHKQRFLTCRDRRHIFDGRELPDGTSGAGQRLLDKLHAALACTDDRPLFVTDFLERLDEAVDPRPILAALNLTGRQAFLAVPHSYTIKTLEELPYVQFIRTP